MKKKVVEEAIEVKVEMKEEPKETASEKKREVEVEKQSKDKAQLKGINSLRYELTHYTQCTYVHTVLPVSDVAGYILISYAD